MGQEFPVGALWLIFFSTALEIYFSFLFFQLSFSFTWTWLNINTGWSFKDGRLLTTFLKSESYTTVYRKFFVNLHALEILLISYFCILFCAVIEDTSFKWSKNDFMIYIF